MNIILLSGGSGKRLWPLSNEVMAKQFLKIYKVANGDYESMVQRVYHQIKQVDSAAKIVIATSKTQISSIVSQLGDNVNLSIEPSRRDTFPAILLSVAYMHDLLKINENDVVAVCPVDHYVDIDYYQVVNKLCCHAMEDDTDIVLMGVVPSYPSEKYGYIIPQGEKGKFENVKQFKEKPTIENAKKYISQGALWNAGVFAFKIKYILDIASKRFGTNKYSELYSLYDTLPQNSFDYEIVENAKKVQVMRYHGNWRDVGSWSALIKTMENPIIGRVIKDNECRDVSVINNLKIPILCMGLKNIIIIASPDGMLVSDVGKSDQIKSYAEKIHQDVMYVEKSWGSFQVLDNGINNRTAKIIMKKNAHMSYHLHEFRDEVWTVIDGKGKILLNGKLKGVEPGDTILIPAGNKHTIFSITELILLEVQIGKDISIKDKKKYELPIVN